MSGARDYKPSDIKRLFAFSGNNCAEPKCPRKLIGQDDITVVGKICHISAASKNGPRWKKMTNDERRSFDNLILLCDEHHQIIDNKENESTYTEVVLKKWKEDHEAKNQVTPIEVKDDYLDQLYNQLTEVLVIVSETHQNVINIRNEVSNSSKEVSKIGIQMNNFITAFENKISENKNDEEFINKKLDLKYDWIGSEKVKIFEDILKQYNDAIASKREQFIFTQNIIKNFINVPQLKEKVNEWILYQDEPEKLDQLDFISTGIMAFNCLEQIPSHIQKDIQQLNWCPIHHAFFDGYLGSFIKEIKNTKSLKIDLEKIYKHDRYLFENLKRIIDSLQAFLVYDVDNIYSEKTQAKIIKYLPESFLLLSTESEISLRNPIKVEEVYASLPLDKQFRVSRPELVRFDDKTLIIGFNAKECFYWNPQEDITHNVLYDTKENERISNVFCKVGENGKIYTQIQISNNLLHFINFEKTNQTKLDLSVYMVPHENGFIGIKNSLDKTGNLLYRIQPNLNSHPILTVESLRKIVRENKKINEWYLNMEKNEDPQLSNLFDLGNITIQKIIHNKEELFLIKGSTRKTGILLLVRITGIKLEPLTSIHLKKSTSVSINYVSNNSRLDLCCALLDLNRKDEVCEYVRIEDFKLISTESILKDRDEKIGVRDMFYAAMSSNNIYMCEEGYKLLIYSITNKKFKEYYFENDRINFINYINLNNL